MKRKKKKGFKNFLWSIVGFILLILLLPLIVVGLLIGLIQSPFERHKYKKSPYFQKSGKPYTFFCTHSGVYKLYDLITKESLPLDYFVAEETEFFAFGDILLIPAPSQVYFEKELGDWVVNIDGREENDGDLPVGQFVGEVLAKFAKSEPPRLFRAAFLMAEKEQVLDDLTKYPSPYFLVYGDDSFAADIRNFITYATLNQPLGEPVAPRIHEMKLNAAPFESIREGKKTYELRLYDEKRKAICIGDKILFTKVSTVFTPTPETLLVRVTSLQQFPSFADLYEALPLTACGYSEEELSSASPDDMLAYYSREEELQNGVLAIGITL